MTKRKRAILLILICVSMSFIIGAGELRDNNKLIDLQLAIENAKIGTQGNGNEKKDDPKVSPTPTTVPSKIYTIVIEDTTIKWDSSICEDISSLEYKLSLCTNRDKVILNGDFAEAHTYREVELLLDRFVIEKNLMIEKKKIE